MVRTRAVTLILLVLLCSNANAFGFGKKIKGHAKVSPLEKSEELTTLLKPLQEDRTQIYHQALELLSSIQASPSCQRLATANLLNSCQSIDGSEPASEAFVDETRSIYAAQLAVCEIQSANAIVPQRCEALSINRKSRMSLSRNSDVQTIGKMELSGCLQALESRPQWWTSYSNSRQNAVVICQAARSDVEKDEIINLYKSSIQTNRDADAALSEAVKYSQEAIRRQHEEFGLVKQAIQKQVQDIETAGGKAQFLLQKLMTKLNAGFQGALENVALKVKTLENEITGLYANVVSANTKSLDLEKNIGKVFQKAAEGTAELASVHTQYLEHSDELTKRLQMSLLHMREVDVHDLVMVVQEMHGRIESTSNLIFSVSARQSVVDQQMARLGQVMVGLQENAQALQDAQLRQESNQARLHSNMEAGFNASLSQLSMIELSAGKLQSALQEASQSIAQMTSMSWVVGTLWKWGSLALILSLLASVVLSGHTNFARYITGTITTLVIIKCTVALLLEGAFGSYPFSERRPVEQMTAFAFTIGILISIGWFYSKHVRSSAAKLSSPIDLSLCHIGQTSSERKLHSTWRI